MTEFRNLEELKKLLWTNEALIALDEVWRTRGFTSNSVDAVRRRASELAEQDEQEKITPAHVLNAISHLDWGQ